MEIENPGINQTENEEQKVIQLPVEDPKKGYVFTQDNLKKKFRLSEFLSEKIITGVAFLSIAIIALIFFFVFREAAPIFTGKPEKKTESSTSAAPERYGEETSGTVANQPERYTGDEEVQKPERYGVAEDSVQTQEQFYQDSILSDRGETAITGSDKATFKSLTGKAWQPVSDYPRYGLVPLVVGTIKITLIGILFAAPIAILAALFSAAFAPTWLREIIKPAIELLAGFPSVVIGFFALMVMATVFQDIFDYDTRLNAFVGGVAMALAAIPIIFTITEDVMTAVPKTYKEASLALGASKWQTAFFVTLPAATPGIFAAVLLGIGRIFGETMIALMATGNASMLGINPFESVRTLAATIGAEMAEVVFGDTHYNVLFLIGALLFIFTFTLNAIAEFYVKGKLMRRFQGENCMRKLQKFTGGIMVGITGLSVVLIIAVIIVMLTVIIIGGKDTMSWKFLTTFPEDGMTKGGIFPALFGTALMVIIMSIAAVPFGTITALYLTEYARENSLLSRAIQFAVRTLAMVPSIIFGLFGLGFFIKFVGGGMDDAFFGGHLKWAQPNILWASLTMALLTLPVIIVSVEESIRTVPRELREASLALGATKWQTILRVVLPGSRSGILTGTILAVSRGAGEVAPILFTGAAYYLATLPVSVSDQFMSLGYHIYIMSTQSSNVDQTLPIQFATTIVLLMLTFVLNFVAVIIRARLRRGQ